MACDVDCIHRRPLDCVFWFEQAFEPTLLECSELSSHESPIPRDQTRSGADDLFKFLYAKVKVAALMTVSQVLEKLGSLADKVQPVFVSK